MSELPSYARVRQTKRAAYDRPSVHAVLDAGLVAHVGFVAEGRPMVIPMAYGRYGDTLYLHGASKTRIVAVTGGAPLCLTVTLVDGIVAARSAFHHSMNYRSVVVHGAGRLVTEEAEREAALRVITDHLLPGRWAEVRPMLAKERKATGVIALGIDAASVKRREGGPVEEPGDEALPIWGGVVPVTTALGRPVGDGIGGAPPPLSVAAARARFSA